jgi:anti-sigma regulatory factor (Ser/Thr protein kinase)
MVEPPNVCLNLSNQPENVVLVREMLSGMAETIGLDGNDLNDIRTAVTEACNNVALHAYEGKEGPLQIEVFLSVGTVEVVVRDQGTGIKPRIRGVEEEALGIGLSIIQALAPRVEFNDVAGNGTEVRMEFATARTRALEALTGDRFEPPTVTSTELPTTTAVAVAPSALARKVLPRVMCVLAARARFSTDRISDAELLADALVARAPESSTGGDHLSVSVQVEPRNLHLRIGPLSPGSSQRLIVGSAVDGLGAVIEKLTDDHEVAMVGSSSELLALQLLDRR